MDEKGLVSMLSYKITQANDDILFSHSSFNRAPRASSWLPSLLVQSLWQCFASDRTPLLVTRSPRPVHTLPSHTFRFSGLQFAL